MKRGFTLVELLVVLLILGVLVGLAVPRYMQSTKTAKRTTFETNLKEITKALEDYKLQREFQGFGYPPTLEVLRDSGIFNKEPINPYTGKSMLSGTSTDSGLLYQSTGPTYKLCVVQRDIEDVNNNGIVDEVLPLTTKSVCIGDMRSNIQLTFIRPSVAYTSDGSQVAENVPRFEQGKFGQAVMVEEGTTNLFTNPRLLNNGSGWMPNFDTVWVDSSGEYPYIHCETQWAGVYQTLYLNATTYTLSYLVKHKSGSNHIGSHFDGTPTMKIRIDGGEWKHGNIITVPSDDNWHLVEIQATYTTAGSYRVYLQPGRGGTEVSEFYFKYAQIEQKPYATSFIDGTRAAETLTIPTAGVLNPQEGTVEFWVYINDIVWATKPLRIWSIPTRTGLASDALAIYHGTANEWAFIVDNETYFDFGSLIPSIGWVHFAFTWKMGEYVKVYINGVLARKITGVNIPNFGSVMAIGSRADNTRHCNTLIDDLRISNRARTDEEIAAAYQSNQPLPVDAWTTLKADFDGNLDAQGGIIQ